MAEIRLEYPILKKKIEDSIKKNIEDNSEKQDYAPLPDFFEAAIMTSLSERADDNTIINHQDAYDLWNMRIQSGDQGPFGNNYIIIQDVILQIVQKLIEKGAMGLLIREQFLGSVCTPVDLIEFGNTLLQSLKSLNGCDICLAYKGADQPFSVFYPVSIGDIKAWFPVFNDSDGLHECNMTDAAMHRSCTFFNYEDHICSIAKNGLDDSMKSLQRKGIIIPPSESETYRFKW